MCRALRYGIQCWKLMVNDNDPWWVNKRNHLQKWRTPSYLVIVQVFGHFRCGDTNGDDAHSNFEKPPYVTVGGACPNIVPYQLWIHIIKGQRLRRWRCLWKLQILCQNPLLIGGLEHKFYFSIQLGMPSSQLTHIFQRGRSTTNQVRSPYHRLRTDRMVDQADHQWIGHVRGAYRAGTVAALHCCHGWWIDREKGAWPCYFDNEFPGLKRISIGDP